MLSSIKLQHERLGFSLTPFSDLRFRLALRSLPLTMRTHVHHAPPLPFDLLVSLVGAASGLRSWAVPFRALLIFAFFSFARLSSLLPVTAGPFDASRYPTLCDLRLVEGGARLRLKFSKTRQEANGGFEAPFRPSFGPVCPVRTAKTLLELAAQRRSAPLSPLFAQSPSTLGGARFLVQAQARRFLGQLLGALGLPPTAFTFHSFRRGGCTLAFERGAQESDLALHGDWRSSAIRGYYPAALARERVASFLSAPQLSASAAPY